MMVAPITAPITPAEFASRCRVIVATFSGDAQREAAEKLNADLLGVLGYDEGLAIVEASRARWNRFA